MSRKRSFSVAEARDRLPGLLRDAEQHPVEITRRGKPVAVLLCREDYDRLLGNVRSFWEALRELRASPDFVGLDLTGVFQGTRDRSPGREPPSW